MWIQPFPLGVKPIPEPLWESISSGIAILTAISTSGITDH